MDLGLGGKVALVTAASRGIGRAVAEEFAREGADVAICARGRDALDEAVTRAVGAVTAAVQQVVAIVTPHAMPAVPALPPGGIEPPSTG